VLTTIANVKIEPVVWYDADGQKHVTEKPYLQIRLTSSA
jgi:hypothetical protein